MAIDISKNNSHKIFFPSFVASAMGQYGHIIGLVLQSDSDNGEIFNKGNYVSFAQYTAVAVTDNAVEGIIRDAASEGGFYVEITKLPADNTYVSYNAPISPYPETELRDEGLFYNASGSVSQGYELHVGDIFTLNNAAFTGTPVKGKTVKYAAGKYVVQ